MASSAQLPWRFVFTDLGTVTTTWANGLLTNRRLTFTLNQAATIEAAVWPDDARVNTLFADGLPLVAQTKRLIYGFRREAPVGGVPWVCRAAGILMSPQDEGDPDIPLSHVQAWDPWMYMGARPCQLANGDLVGTQGLNWYDVRGNEIVLQLLKNSIDNNQAVVGIDGIRHGNGTFIDAGPSWGGTGFWGGTIQDTPAIVFTASQGQSVADAWTQLCDAGNLDIVLKPIYDPIARPGYTHELSIYNLAGRDRINAVFGWDIGPRNVKKISRLHDGTPGAFFNLVQYFSGQGGFPIPANGPLPDADSVAAFGSWWCQQFFPNQGVVSQSSADGSTVFQLARQALQLAKQGKRTLTLDPIPDRSPSPFVNYEVGDRVAAWASKKLRVKIGTTFPDKAFRVLAIPVEVSDDGIESVAALLLSPDYRLPVLAPGQGTIQTNMVATSQRANVLRTQTMSKLSPP